MSAACIRKHPLRGQRQFIDAEINTLWDALTKHPLRGQRQFMPKFSKDTTDRNPSTPYGDSDSS